MVRDPVTVDASEDVSRALQIMLFRGLRHLPVLRDGRLVGIVSERDILAGRLEDESFYEASSRRVCDVMTSPAEQVHPNQDLEDAAGAMAVHKLGCLPVVDAGRVVGLLTAIDLLAHTAQSPIPQASGPDARVGDLMTTSLLAAHPDDRLLDAAASMLQQGARHLPVVDMLDRVVGMLSDRDVRTAIGNPLEAETREEPAQSRRLLELRVQDAMTAEPHAMSPETQLSEAVTALLDERFGALPIVDDDDRLLGIVSYVDVLRAIAADWEQRA